MMSEEMMLKFWDVLVECLVEFHHLDYGQAHEEVVELRGRLRESDRLVMAKDYNAAPGPTAYLSSSFRREQASDVVRPSDIVYHEEPFYLACDLMDRQLKIEDHQEKYNAILERHGW